MKKLLYLVAASLVLASPLVGQSLVGSGQVRTEVRKASGFSSVDMSGAGSLKLTKGGGFSVTVKLDDNLLPWYLTEVRGETLVLRFKDGISIKNPTQLVVEVTMPSLSGLSLSGACDARLGEGFSGKELRIEASGAARIQGKVDYGSLILGLSGAGEARLEGRANRLGLKLTGAAEVDTSSLVSQIVTAELSGACHLFVRAEEKLNIEATGASTVTWFGSASVEARTSGASSVRKGS